MKLLAIDTSTKVTCLAIFENGRLIIEKNLFLEKRGEGMVSLIKQILSEAKINLKEIEGFIIGIGPGSFTGLRIGASLVKGFCLAKRVPILPISSLDLIAYNGYLYNKQICAVVDAKRQMVYACLYKKTKDKLSRVYKYMLCPIDNLIKKVKQEFKGEVLFIGDGISLYRNKISQGIKNAVFAEEDFWYPKAKSLGELGWPRFRKYATKNTDKINPLYLYPKECQVRR